MKYIKKNDIYDDKTAENIKKVKILRRNSNCLFNNIKIQCSCEKNKKTKENHLIQKSKYLKSIAVNNEVMYFDIEDEEFYRFGRQLKKQNIKKVHAYNVLCGNHDKDLFGEIENGKEFDINNKKQCFQFAMRSFIFNYSEQLLKDEFVLRDTKIEYIAGDALKKRMIIFEKFKKYYRKGEWDVLETYSIELDRRIQFISCSSFYPFYDIKKRYRGYIKDEKIFFNIFPKGEKSIIIMSYFKDSSHYCKDLCDEICQYSKKGKIKEIEEYFSKIITVQDKTVTLSPELWDRWNSKQQKNFYKYAHLFKKGTILGVILKLLKLRYGKVVFNLFG
ncbi:hypothetical protein [Clostridium saccharoperbutylacetonicum]|uniref:hypothetical protein n=1 Tax=Clostridium saccharoperbutylacetonicum TaxID=36745 RepID=UPI000983983F|nr:hypothetical protein [Clostridium saccharoperbutylacetonicum]AQR98198.1 hypothetical protein CLSAP_55530 [Clostridium saccharoperbutylacetonicum]NSB34093.1 hypothetical protein [Clostridium saccharoperbutylacetonicum]